MYHLKIRWNNLLFFLLCLFFVSNSFSKSSINISLDFRGEFEHFLTDRSNVHDYSRFYFPYSLMLINGSVYEKIGYAFRYRFSKPGGSINDVDNLASNVDYFYIHKNIIKNLRLAFGKMYHTEAGHEDLENVNDIYLFSQVYQSIPDQQTGIELAYTLSNQKIILKFLNYRPTQRSTAQNVNGHKRFSYNIQFQGNLADIVYPLITFISWPNYPNTSMYSPNQQDYLDPKNNHIFSIGGKLRLRPISFEFDYSSYREEYNSASPQNIIRRMHKVNSYIYKLKYLGKHFKPLTKLIINSWRKDGVTLMESTGFVFALQYYPYKDKNFRFHTVYTLMDSNYKNGYNLIMNNSQQKTRDQRFLFGFRGKFDIFNK